MCRFPKKLLAEIDELVEQGHYACRTDALRDAVRLLLRSQIASIPGKPLGVSKDEVWDDSLKQIKE